MRFNAVDRQPSARIVADKRFLNLDWTAQRVIAAGLNDNVLEPVVDPKALRDAWHHEGEIHFRTAIESGNDKYPEWTTAMPATLADWVKAIQTNRSQWAPIEATDATD